VCALTREAEVYCWGSNNAAQIGSPDVDRKSTEPVRVADLGKAVYVMGGERHTCAALQSGELKCWGGNSYGQLGDGTEEPSGMPLPVDGMGDAMHLDGGTHTCGVTDGENIYCWGKGGQGQLGTGNIVDDSLLEPTEVQL
jgi:alpha-tubulin suppressor-like RCC1 family protein